MPKEKHSTFRGKIVSSAQKQKEGRGRGYLELPKGIKIFRLPDNTRTFSLDFLPYVVTNQKHLERNDAKEWAMPGDLWYRSAYKIHKNVGSENETVVCPRTVGKKCPICEYQRKRIKEGADKEEFKLLYPQERSLYLVVPIGHKDYEEVPMVWDMADFLFQDTLIEELKESPDSEDFVSLETGKTATIRFKWKEIGKNSFPEAVSITFAKREPYDNDVLDQLPSLDDMIKVQSYEELSSKFFGIEEEDAGTLKDIDEEAEEHTPSLRKKKTIPQSEEKEEEKEEAPSLRRTRPATPKDEVEEEAPARRSRSRAPEEKPSDDDKCPYGHKFGVDTDDYPKDCDKCKIWDDCIEVKEKQK